jgi:hypothetical protein
VLFSWLFVGLPAGQQTVNWKAKHLPIVDIYSTPPDDGLQICPKHIEVDWQNKLVINSASSWFLLHRSLLRVCCYLRWQTSSLSLSHTHTHTHTHKRNIRCFRFINVVRTTALYNLESKTLKVKLFFSTRWRHVWRTAPLILNFGTRRMWVVIYTSRPLHVRKGPWYPLNWGEGGGGGFNF